MIGFYNRASGDLVGQRVYVYRNLTKGCWSLKSVKTGRVLAHAGSLTLKDPVFKVSEAGRQRVIRDQQKNVHAGIVGTVMGPVEHEVWINSKGVPARKIAVTYNPYRFSTFVTKEPYQNDLGYTQFPVHRSDGAIFNGSSVYAVDLD